MMPGTEYFKTSCAPSWNRRDIRKENLFKLKQDLQSWIKAHYVSGKINKEESKIRHTLLKLLNIEGKLNNNMKGPTQRKHHLI